MVSAIGIVPIALDFLWRDQDVLPVLPALGTDVTADVLDLGWIAIRIVAATPGQIVRHVPRRIELFVQSFILRRMAVLCGGGRNHEHDHGRDRRLSTCL